MLLWVKYMESRSEDGLVVREEEKGWCLGDWCTLEKLEMPAAFVNTCLFVKALRIFFRIHKILNKNDDLSSLEKLEQLRVDVRDLMQFLDKSPKKQIDVNIDDTVEPSGYDGGDTIIDIRTFLPLGRSSRLGTDISKRRYGLRKWSKIPRQKATSSYPSTYTLTKYLSSSGGKISGNC